MIRKTIQKHHFMKLILLVIFILTGSIFWPMHKRGQNQTRQILTLYKDDPAFKADSLTDLPLLYFDKANRKSHFWVLMVPGDGGWRKLENTIATKLMNTGIPVIGLNTKPYFSTTKEPEQVAIDFQRIYNHFSPIFKTDTIVLLGYSFSAEILPFVYNRFESALQSKVIKIVMLAPSNGADFKTSPIYKYDPQKSRPVLPEMQSIAADKFLLICEKDAGSIFHNLSTNHPYPIIKVDFNHLFLGHAADIADTIANQLERIK